MAEAAPQADERGVVLGSDDHLFDPQPGIANQVSGKLTLSPSQVQRWVSLIETRHAWCRQRNAHYYLIVTPLKYIVYADKLPAGTIVSDDRPIRRLLAALTPEVRPSVIYPADALRDGRAEAETYFHTDMHWTEFGAYLAYLQLLDRLRHDNAIARDAPETVLERSKYRRVGDLGIRITPERAETVTRVSPVNAGEVRRIFANFTYNVGQVEILERSIPAGLRGVMFRDSHGSFLLPFLAADFKRLVAVAADNMFYDLLRSEQPDVVITQFAEQTLCDPDVRHPGELRLPDDFPPLDFAAFAGVALPLVANAASAADREIIVDLDFTGRPEPVWAVGESTEMVLKCRVPYAPCDLALTVSPFLHPPQVTSQPVDIVVNATLVGSFVVRGDGETLACRVPLDCLFSGRTLRLELFHPNCASPQALGIGADPRNISLKIQRLVIRAVV